MSFKKARPYIAVLVLFATILSFVWYFKSHPEVWQSLRSVSPATVAALFFLYLLFMATLIWIQRATLSLCGLNLGAKESILLVIYSSVINFFGPLQSGPAFRAAYLKARHNLHLKRYALATIAYYGLYAAFSGILLLAFIAGWKVILLLAAVFLVLPFIGRIKRFKNLQLRHIRSLAAATLSQVLVTSIIYFIEIHSSVPVASYLQALAYTGAANFALFVSITPGAIGFRESFLLLSQRLHGISNEAIAAASLIDRSVYILMLLLLAVVLFGLHANDYLKVKQIKKVARRKTVQ